MGQYFYDVMKKEDLERLPYLPTIADLMEKCKKDYETYPAISDKKTTYTYGELYHRGARRRSYLASLGLKPGDRVAVMGKNTLDTMELYLAVTTGGYTVIMLPNALNAQALAGISRRFELSLLIAQECFLPLTEGVACRVENSAEANADNAALFYTNVDPFIGHFGTTTLQSFTSNSHRMAEHLVNLMNNTNDPRLGIYAVQQNNEWTGLVSGYPTTETNATICAYLNKDVLGDYTSPYTFMRYDAVLFILYEAA